MAAPMSINTNARTILTAGPAIEIIPFVLSSKLLPA